MMRSSSGRRPRLLATSPTDATGDISTPDSARDVYMTQVWLAEGIEPNSDVTDEVLSHQTVETRVNELVPDAQAQDRLLASYAEQTGVSLPAQS